MKGIKAKVTIIDEETGLTLVEDKLIAPCREDIDPNLPVTDYEFRFRFKRLDDHFKRIFDQQIVEPNKELLNEITGHSNPGYTASSEEIHKALEEKHDGKH
jgi:division protein CdvB (Snf7/Vps24/ESCRT-III family)